MFIYIGLETLILFIIILIILKKIRKTKNTYIAALRSPKLNFPNKQSDLIMHYIYYGEKKYRLELDKNNKIVY